MDGVGSFDLARSLHALAELATEELSLVDTLTRVAEYAVLAIPGAEGGGLTFIREDGSETLVATADFVTAVDAVQYGLREGPCITAAAEGRTVMSDALGEDHRWPTFGSQVASTLGVHSALSLPLTTPRRVVGAMNIYARRQHAFDDHAADLGQAFAAPAAIAVQNAQVLAQARTLATQLRDALSYRTAVDQAIGVLVGRDRLNADQALRHLHQLSDALGEPLHDVATAVVREAADRAGG